MNGTGNVSGKGSGKRNIVLRKAYEIGYAVFRISSRTGSVALREHLERQAFSLLDAAAVENYGWVSMVSRAIEYLMRFGADVGLIHETNKEVMLEQLTELDSFVAGPEKAATVEAVPLGDIFSAQEPLFGKDQRVIQRQDRQEGPVIHETMAPVPAATPVSMGPTNIPATGNPANPEIRQSAILEKIRQTGNCRLRDLLEVLPDYSERTLRYDLQALAEQNLIERIGSGGPAVFYRIRQTV